MPGPVWRPTFHWLGLMSVVSQAFADTAPPQRDPAPILASNLEFHLGHAGSGRERKEGPAGWQPVTLGPWQSQIAWRHGQVPSKGRYRADLVVPVDALDVSWHASAGIVGNSSVVLLNGTELGRVRNEASSAPLPQRTLHVAPVPPSLLRPGTNRLEIEFENTVGGGGILEGPVGLIPSKDIPSRIVPDQAKIAALRGGIESIGILAAVTALVIGRTLRSPTATSAGFCFLALISLSIIHSVWVVPVLPSWLRQALITLFPISVVRFSGLLVARAPRAERLHLLVAGLSCVVAVMASSKPEVSWKANLLFALGTLFVLVAQVRARSDPLSLDGKVLLGSLAALGAAGSVELSLRKHALIPWAAMWWDPMVLANLAFVLANLWVVVREQIRVRRDRARLHQSLLNAELTQRRDLASRLHDEVLQDLIYLKLRSDELAGDLPQERRTQTAEEITTGIGGAIRYLRQMMEDLQPIRHQGRTLGAALLQLERKVRQRYGIRTVFTLPQEFPPVPDREAEALYRAAQEVVVNACKHSRCRTLSLHLATELKRMELSIRDDGVGFETGSAQRPNHGLAYLRDRIAWLGGQVRIDSQPETGTLILISLPLSRTEGTQ